MSPLDIECQKCKGKELKSQLPPAQYQKPYPLRGLKRLSQIILAIVFSFTFYWVALNTYGKTQQDAVFEAVIRDTFQSSSSEVIFVSINGKDPSNEWLARFNNLTTSVQKYSKAAKVPDKAGGVSALSFTTPSYLDPETGRIGRHHYLESPTWISPFKAMVYFYSDHDGEDFVVVKKNGRWVVLSHELDWSA